MNYNYKYKVILVVAMLKFCLLLCVLVMYAIGMKD